MKLAQLEQLRAGPQQNQQQAAMSMMMQLLGMNQNKEMEQSRLQQSSDLESERMRQAAEQFSQTMGLNREGQQAAREDRLAGRAAEAEQFDKKWWLDYEGQNAARDDRREGLDISRADALDAQEYRKLKAGLDLTQIMNANQQADADRRIKEQAVADEYLAKKAAQEAQVAHSKGMQYQELLRTAIGTQGMTPEQLVQHRAALEQGGYPAGAFTVPAGPKAIDIDAMKKEIAQKKVAAEFLANQEENALMEKTGFFDYYFGPTSFAREVSRRSIEDKKNQEYFFGK